MVTKQEDSKRRKETNELQYSEGTTNEMAMILSY